MFAFLTKIRGLKDIFSEMLLVMSLKSGQLEILFSVCSRLLQTNALSVVQKAQTSLI